MDVGGLRAGRLNAAVAAEVRAIIARRGWRQSTLAERLGENEMWVSRRLRGKQAITLGDLERIADALSIKPANLLGLAEQTGPQMNADSFTVANRPARDSYTPAKRPVDNRPSGGPPNGRRPERVIRQPIAA